MIIIRQEALKSNLKRYFTGKPCRHGHIHERATSNGVCLECHRLKEAKKNAEEPNRVTERNRRFYQQHSEAQKIRRRNYYYSNREASISSARQYQKDNPHVKRAIDAKRRASKLQRTPEWADIDAIKEFYRRCPKGMTVDHIIPLQGEMVSGLHVHQNLQYLTPSENSSKGNQFNPEKYPNQLPPSLDAPFGRAAF